MSLDTSIILVFELRAILAGRTRDWTQFSQIGTCLIPQLVLEELEFLTKRAVEPEEERIAREFLRFFPDSGWQVHHSRQTHPALSNKDGAHQSKSARLQLALAESIYSIATDNLDQLVVLVSNQGNLRNELEKIAQNNLATLPLAQLIQWLRTQQKPVNISQKLEDFNSNHGNSHNNSSLAKKTSSSTKKTQKTSPSSASKSPYQSTYKPQAKVQPKTNSLASIFSTVVALSSIIVVGGVSWYLLQPKSFQQFWQKTNLPSLPSR